MLLVPSEFSFQALLLHFTLFCCTRMLQIQDLSYLVGREVLQQKRWAREGVASLGKQFHALLADDTLTTISCFCENPKDGKKRACTHGMLPLRT